MMNLMINPWNLSSVVSLCLSTRCLPYGRLKGDRARLKTDDTWVSLWWTSRGRVKYRKTLIGWLIWPSIGMLLLLRLTSNFRGPSSFYSYSTIFSSCYRNLADGGMQEGYTVSTIKRYTSKCAHEEDLFSSARKDRPGQGSNLQSHTQKEITLLLSNTEKSANKEFKELVCTGRLLPCVTTG